MERPYEDTGRTGVRRPIERAEARPSVASPMLGLGGLALIIGSLLTWIDTGDAPGADMSGSSISDGRIAMGIGFALVVMAIYMAGTRRYGHWYDADLFGAALGAIATTVIVATWVSLPDGQTADLGLYLSLVGAVVALVGAVIALSRSRMDADDAQDRGDRVRRAA